MQRILAWACLLALLVNGSALAVLSLAPAWCEQHVRGGALALMKRELSARWDEHVDEALLLARVRGAVERRLAGARADNAALLAALNTFFDQLCQYDCEERDRTFRALADAHRDSFGRVPAMQAALVRVQDWAKSRYATLIGSFVVELRIFTGTNAALFFLALIGFARGSASRTLTIVTMLLLLATLAGACFYATSQSWLLTFVTADYAGWSYLAGVGVLFAFLLDATFLQGRIILAILGVGSLRREPSLARPSARPPCGHRRRRG